MFGETKCIHKLHVSDPWQQWNKLLCQMSFEWGHECHHQHCLLQRNCVVSAQYLCNVCIWGCECVSVCECVSDCECVSLMVLNLFLTINVWATSSSLTDFINQCVQEQQLRKSSQLLGIPSDYSLLRNLVIFLRGRCFWTLIGHVL